MFKQITKLIVFLLLLSGIISLNAASDDEWQEKRGFMIGASLAWAIPVYGEPLSDLALDYESYTEISRVSVGLGLELGFAVSNNVYIIAGIDGMGDRFYDSFDFEQWNSYLYFGGIKAYPFHKGLILEAKVGAGRDIVNCCG